ncbi:hypothetical protein CEUSTIGMA_g8777.t1 [Chlamydomonas eustigma]|uniref:YchJ-like middle NTF2-like domain-containing protein n=1 Tax=Chlamydomonas eustigma TaxID=1157962 RepID=A0A250XE64_9CHLO|nr:hypothetical protein CEUSTIGMA_g8777.t1 [Chlamydomonas eustigma]|eukprot:GAX81346.1 hypothetical protein CEUSTIGMA_g8777.t1 [Chlamydomonas eustigma]
MLKSFNLTSRTPAPFRPCRSLQSIEKKIAFIKHGLVSANASKGFGTQAPPSQTCPCGSKVVYKECCEKYHTGKAVPDTPELTLRSRFSAYSKGKVDYLVSTDRRPNNDQDQLKRDITASCNATSFSGLKVLESQDVPPNAYVIKFQYNSKAVAKQAKTAIRMGRAIGQDAKENMAERNLDGSLKVLTTVEKSKFQKGDDGAWALIESEFIQ